MFQLRIRRQRWISVLLVVTFLIGCFGFGGIYPAVSYAEGIDTVCCLDTQPDQESGIADTTEEPAAQSDQGSSIADLDTTEEPAVQLDQDSSIADPDTAEEPAAQSDQDSSIADLDITEEPVAQLDQDSSIADPDTTEEPVAQSDRDSSITDSDKTGNELTGNMAVQSETDANIHVTIRVEGPDYTILPETVVEVPDGASNADALRAAGLEVTESGGMINAIDGVRGQFYWSLNPWIDGFEDGDSVVYAGNGSSSLAQISLPEQVNAGENFTVTVTKDGGSTVSGAEVIYYQEGQHRTPTKTGIKTDSSGQATLSIAEPGTYYVAAESSDIVRTKAQAVQIATQSENTLTIETDPDYDLANLKIGNKPVLKAIVTDSDGNEVTGQEINWTVSDEALAMVKPNRKDASKGKLVTLAKGTVTVTASLAENPAVKSEVTATIDDNIKHVFIRVEGYDHTIIERTPLDVPLVDLSPYLGEASGSSGTESSGWGVDKFDGPTNAHAILKAMMDNDFKPFKQGEDQDGPGLYDFQDYGWSLYIAMIDGDREFDHSGMSGWMYRVNGEMPGVGCNDMLLNDGDDIVWYYGAFGFDNAYTELKVDQTEVSAGEDVTLTATGDNGGFASDVKPLKDATVLVNGEEYLIDGQVVKTDSEGKATISFTEPGEYQVSLIRFKYNSAIDEDCIDIVRPVPVTITVTPQADLSLRERIEAVLPDTVNFALENHYSWDWVAIGLARTDNADKIPADYLQNVAENMKELAAKEDTDKFVKPTEYERSVLGVLAAGGDPRNLDGLDLIQRIYSSNHIDTQGINAKIFGLIALDAGDYPVPENAQWTREKLVSDILDAECEGGGWTFYGANADPDMTGMAMIALAPYYNEKPEVKAAVDQAVDVLSSLQQDDGGYASWGTSNSESCAQVIMGLCANGFDPAGEKFTKSEGNVVDALLSFKVENSGFAHVKDGDANGMANEQALYALAQYLYFLDGKGCIFRWDVEQNDPETTQFEVKVLNTPEYFNLGKDADVTAEATNNSDEAQDVLLIIALYDDQNMMLNYSYSTKNVAPNTIEKLTSGFRIPMEGNYQVKAFVWENWGSIKPLSNVEVIPVQ